MNATGAYAPVVVVTNGERLAHIGELAIACDADFRRDLSSYDIAAALTIETISITTE